VIRYGSGDWLSTQRRLELFACIQEDAKNHYR
jgi:hypothetical protein